MPTVKELNIQLEDRPGTLAKVCRALSDRKVNILAFDASATERNSQLRLVVDNLSAAKTILDAEGLRYREIEVAQVTLPSRPGELARVADRLADAKININYAYAGMEPGTNAPLLFFGVAEAGRAAKVLEQSVAAAGA